MIAAAEPQAALSCRGLTLACGGRCLLRGLDLDLRHGEVLAVTGASGCGKSTLLRTLAGQQPPAAGSLHGLGRGRLAIAFQDPGLPGALTGLQAVLAGRLHVQPWWRIWGLPQADMQARALATDLGVDHLLDRPVATASGGERQRLAVARALLHGGTCLLLDEPVSQLDPDCGRRVMGVLRQAADAGRAILAVVHQPELVAAHADRELAIGADGAWTLTARR